MILEILGPANSRLVAAHELKPLSKTPPIPNFRLTSAVHSLGTPDQTAVLWNMIKMSFGLDGSQSQSRIEAFTVTECTSSTGKAKDKKNVDIIVVTRQAITSVIAGQGGGKEGQSLRSKKWSRGKPSQSLQVLQMTKQSKEPGWL